VNIRINDPSDAAGISALFTRVFIEEEGANSDGDAGRQEFLTWKYAGRKSGRPLSIAALDDGGRVIGHTGLVFQSVQGPAGPALAALNVDSAVDKEHRTLSVYLGLMKRAIAEAKTAGAGILYTHANGNAEPVMRKALRFKEVFGYRAFVPVPGIPFPPFRRGKSLPRRISSFPEGFLPVDSRIRLSTEEYEARFIGCPTRSYESLLARSGPGVGGDAEYVVVGKWKRPKGIRCLLVLSVFRSGSGPLPPAADEARARGRALRAVSRALRAPIIVFANDAASRAGFRGEGFIEATRLMERFLGGAIDVIALPLDGKDWSGFRCSLGDIDT
jgi:predicted N-acetyltransferase YhbS